VRTYRIPPRAALADAERQPTPVTPPNVAHRRHPGRMGGVEGRFTRRRPVARRLVPPRAESGRNTSPDASPVGRRSQAPTARPRTGNAVRKVDSSRSILRRFVVPSQRTRRRDTVAACQFRWAPIFMPSRVFRSSGNRVAWASATIDFTSTTSSDRDRACHPRTSTEPRSPNSLKVTSIAVSQPTALRSSTVRSTRSACDSSRSRSRPSPRQRTRTSRSAPTATHRRSRRGRSPWPISPRSTSDTNDLETFAAVARSTWRHPRRIRMTLTDRPMRSRSTRPMVPPRAWPALGGRFTRALRPLLQARAQVDASARRARQRRSSGPAATPSAMRTRGRRRRAWSARRRPTSSDSVIER
jgi:hypothetical protein